MNPTKTLAEVTETVKKLLRLAERGTENEKKVAMEKAMTVAQGYHIDLSLIDTNSDELPQTVGKADIQMGTTISTKCHYIAWLLKKHFNVTTIYSGGRFSGRSIALVGFEQDVDMAKYVLDTLSNEFERLWKSHKRMTNDLLRNKNSFFYGLYLGLNEVLTAGKTAKLVEKVAEAVVVNPTETEETINNRYALALVNQEEAVQKEVARLFPRLRRSGRTAAIRSQNTVNSGREAGRKISILRPLSFGTSNKLASV